MVEETRERNGVAPKGQMKGFTTIYDFKKGVPHIGDYSFYRRVYLTDPVVQTNINIPCRYVWKNSWLIESTNKEASKVVEDYLLKVGFNQKGFAWVKDSKVFGMGYFEYTKDDLYIRNPDTIFVRIDQKGRIVGWEQKTAYQTDPIEFEPDEIIYLSNNPFSDSIYGISDIEAIRYVVTYLKDQAERDVGAMLNKYVGERFIVTAGTETNPFDTPELEELRTYFSQLKFAEDIISPGDVQVDTANSMNHAFDFRAYLDYIIMILSIGMNVPIIFWEGKGSTNATAKVQLKVFEAYIRFIQTQIEDDINTQLVPNIIRDFYGRDLKPEEMPKFRFPPVSLDDTYLQAKTDLIYLNQNVLAEDEVRVLRGFDIRGDLTGNTQNRTNVTGQTGQPDFAKEIAKETGVNAVVKEVVKEIGD